MRYRGCILVSFCFALAVSAVSQISPPAKQLSSIEQTLKSIEANLIASKKKDDAAFFKRTLADNFSLVGVDGKLLQGQDARDNLGDSELVEFTPYDMKVIALGCAAIVTYDAIVRQAPQEDQGPPPRYQHFSSVWVQQAGQWKLQFHQATAAHWGDW